MVQNKKSITGGEYGTNTNIWRLNNMLLKTNALMKKSKRESENTLRLIKTPTTQDLWDTVKAVLRGKSIAIQAYLKKNKKKVK